MTSDILRHMLVLFGVLFIVGTLLCLTLYKWRINTFIHSTLFIKTVFWIPIFLVFIAMLYSGEGGATIVASFIGIVGLREYLAQSLRNLWFPPFYLSLFIAAIIHIPLLFYVQPHDQAARLIIVICFSSVLSDVFAFFFGSFFGKHNLPAWINPHKSWEGIIGQIIGAFAGLWLVVWFVTPLNNAWELAFVIGIASTVGDIVNSITKRQLHIKDWGTTIPGHGGMLDRFASLSFAVAATFWFVLL